jgi:hypothetical protein
MPNLNLPQLVSEPMRPYLHQIAVALSVTLLAVFGNDINRWVKSSVRKHPFPIRLSVFVLLVAFGYGLAGLLVSSLLTRMLVNVDNRYLAAVVLLSFVAVGVLAERKGDI